MRIIVSTLCFIAIGILPITAQQQRITKPQKNVPLSLSANPTLLIGIPIDASAASKEKTEWFSALSEQYLYFRIGSSNKLDIIPSEKIHKAIGEYKNPYTVSIISYDNIAKEYGATHLLHHTYEISRDG